MTKDMYQQLVQRASKDHTTDWDAHRTLCNVTLARAKTLPPKEGIRSKLNVVFALVDEFMFYSREIEIAHKACEVRLLEELDRAILRCSDVEMVCHWTNARDPPSGSFFDEANQNCFLALAIQSRLDLYVEQKLDNEPRLLRAKQGRPLLDYALRPNIVTPTGLPHLVEFLDFEMIRILLDKGADPNQKVHIYGDVTVWGLFLLACYERKDVDDPKVKGTWFQAAEMMIRKGVNRKLKLETTRKEKSTRGSEPNMTGGKTAKYRRQVVRGGMDETEVTVELTAMDLLGEVFGKSRIAELEAIRPDTPSWSMWSIIGWT